MNRYTYRTWYNAAEAEIGINEMSKSGWELFTISQSFEHTTISAWFKKPKLCIP